MKNDTSAKRTLIMSVVMSAPGPIIVGLGLFTGRSTTQLADFFRRSAELLALICSLAVFLKTQREGEDNAARKERLERRANLVVGVVMCLSGAIMVGLSFFSNQVDKGNVIPGLCIALLGVIANTLFCVKYTRLHMQEPNAILAVQGRLYRAKALVDGCVTVALLAVAVFPASRAAALLDTIGSVVVAIYLILCGAKTIRELSHSQKSGQ